MPDKRKSDDTNQPSLDDLISLADAAERSGLSPSHLRHLVTTGEIWGKKLGRNWFTTAQAVDEYQAHEHRPGPKPPKPKKGT
jgi:hypothetical protein